MEPTQANWDLLRASEPFAPVGVQQLLWCRSCPVCLCVKEMDDPDRKYSETFGMPIEAVNSAYAGHCPLAEAIVHAIKMYQDKVLGWPGNPSAVRFYRQEMSRDDYLRIDTRRIGYLRIAFMIASQGAPRELIRLFGEYPHILTLVLRELQLSFWPVRTLISKQKLLWKAYRWTLDQTFAWRGLNVG
jgi:hypothetical protein